MKFIEYELRSVTCEEGQFDFRQPLVPGGNKPGDINHECPPPWRAVAFDSCQESRELSENMLPAEEEKKKNLKTVLCSTFIAKMPSSSDGTAAASTSTLMSLASARLLLKLWFLDILLGFCFSICFLIPSRLKGSGSGYRKLRRIENLFFFNCNHCYYYLTCKGEHWERNCIN